MDEKMLWLKISGSITYYFKSYNRKLSNEDLWLDYVEYGLPDMDGVHTYLDKHTLERIVIGVASFFFRFTTLSKIKSIFKSKVLKSTLSRTLIILYEI